MKLKRTAAAVLAAMTAISAASVCAFAEKNKVELATLDFTDIDGMNGIESLGDGYGLCFSDHYSNDICGIVHLEMGDNGELTYTNVETDIDFSKDYIDICSYGEYILLHEYELIREDWMFTPKDTYHLVQLDKANNRATTIRRSNDWFWVTDDGYQISDSHSNRVITMTKPDGSTVTNKVEGDLRYTVNIAKGGEYIAYLTVQVGDLDGGPFQVYGLDRGGKLTEVYTTVSNQDSSIYDSNDSYIVVATRFPESYYSVDLNTGKGTYTIFEAILPQNGLRRGTKNGRYDEYGIDEELNWGFFDDDGNHVGDWYDDVGDFYGDYAPVVMDGKGYLVDKNFNRVSEMIDATRVITLDDELFVFGNGMDSKLVTYTGDESDSGTSKPADEKPVDYSDGGVTVSAKKGVVADGAKLSVSAVEDKTDDKNVTYEISFKNGDKEVQPNGNVTVKIPVPDAFKDKTVYVYRVEGEKYVDMKAKVENGFVVFETSHFSEYVLTTEKRADAVPEKDNPETGAKGVALTLGLAAIAGAAVVVYRKKR